MGGGAMIGRYWTDNGQRPVFGLIGQVALRRFDFFDTTVCKQSKLLFDGVAQGFNLVCVMVRGDPAERLEAGDHGSVCAPSEQNHGRFV
jgi:hypothetical protein